MFTLAITGAEFFLISLAIGALLAATALQKKQDSPKPITDQTTPLTERGTSLPNVWGTRRLAPMVCWIGDRSIRKSSSGGGKGGGGGGGKTFTYYEGAMHAICVGPVFRLSKIYLDGKIIFPDKANPVPIDSGSVGSSSTITLDNGDTFDIYWGEIDQPINTYLGEDEVEDVFITVNPPRGPSYQKKTGTQPTGDRVRMKVQSRWPNICYIMWRRKFLGSSPTWPNLNYEILRKVTVPQSALSGVTTYITGTNEDGINPASLMWELLNAKFPHGATIPAAEIDKASFEAAGVIFDTEKLAFNSVAINAEQSKDVLTQILLDANCMLSTSEGLLTLRVIRRPASGAVAVYDDDILVGTDPEITVFSSYENVDMNVFTFPDRENNYKEGDRAIIDDSNAHARSTRRQKTIKLPNVIDQNNAERVVQNRMLQELASPALFKLSATRHARSLIPGDIISTSSLGVMRVATKQVSPKSATVELEAIREPFDVQPASYLLGEKPQGDDTPTPTPDISNFVLELPYDVSPISAIGVIRQEAFQRIEGAVIHVSPDDVSYYSIGTEQNTSATITLTQDILEDDFEVEDSGATFIIAEDDTQSVLDLSTDEKSWQIGRQWLVIGTEILFIKSVTALGNAEYRFEGVIRARYDTIREDHPEGKTGFLLNQQEMTILRDPIVVSEKLTLFVKTQPFTAFEIDDLSDQTAFEIPITVRSERPFPADNFVCNDDDQNQNSYPADTSSQIFEWDYRLKQGRGSTAGELPAGEAVTVEDPAPESQFELNFYDEFEVLKGTVLVDQGDTDYTYTNTLRNTHFGARPDEMIVTITAIEGSRRSIIRTITVREE